MSAVDDLARQRAATFRYWREDVSRRPAGEWADVDGVQVHTTGLAVRRWNGAHVTREGVDLAATVPEVAAWFAERAKPWALLVPAELDLTPPALLHHTDQAVMLLHLDALRSAALPKGIAVTDRAPTADVAHVQSEAFGDPYDVTRAFVAPMLGPRSAPPQRTLAAYDGVEPVGCATAVRMDDVAGVYGVAVRQAWRGRGIAAALTCMVLEHARAAGCDLAYLNPSELGYGAFAALGFAGALPMRVWVAD
jgi:GNAT superfamily N-acetyltransferase